MGVQRGQLGWSSGFWLNEWVDRNVEKTTQTKKQVGEKGQLVQFGVRGVEGPWDL